MGFRTPDPRIQSDGVPGNGRVAAAPPQERLPSQLAKTGRGTVNSMIKTRSLMLVIALTAVVNWT
jgi:hypothetical protein